MTIKHITLASVSLNNLVTGDDRNAWMGKEVEVYYNQTNFNKFKVSDSVTDVTFGAAVIFERTVDDNVELVIGYMSKEGFGIYLKEFDSELPAIKQYTEFLNKFETPKTEFECGVEIRISKDLVRKLKAPVLTIQDKLRSYEGLFGRLKETKPFKAFKANDKGSLRTSEEETVYSLKIDSRAVMFFAELAVDYTDYCCRKAAALMALLDFSDFAYKAKEKSARFKKEVEDALK